MLMAAATTASLSPRRQLIANAGALVIGGVLAQAASVFVEAAIARGLGASAYGTFSAVYTVTLLAVLTIDMGMNWKLIEEGSRSPGTMDVNLGTMLSLKLLIFALLYPAAIGVLALAGYTGPFFDLFVIFAPFALLMLVQESLAAVYTASRRNWFNAVFQAAVPVTIFVVVLVFVLPQPSLNRAGMAYVAGSAVPTAIWLWLAIRSHTPRVDASRFKSILRGSYLYGVTALLSYSSFKSGILLLLVLSSAREVAFFAAAFKLVELGYKIPILANRLIAPHLFADSVHRPKEFPGLCDALLHATGALSALTAVVLFVLGAGFIQLIFGGEFAPAAPLLQILGVSLALKTLALLAQSIVTSADQLGFRTRALGWATAFGTVISVPLIVEWGAKGAAIGVLIADVALLAALFWRLRILLPATRLPGLVAVPFAAVAMAIGLSRWMELSGTFELAAAITLVIAVLFLSGYLQPVLRLARNGVLQR